MTQFSVEVVIDNRFGGFGVQTAPIKPMATPTSPCASDRPVSRAQVLFTLTRFAGSAATCLRSSPPARYRSCSIYCKRLALPTDARKRSRSGGPGPRHPVDLVRERMQHHSVGDLSVVWTLAALAGTVSARLAHDDLRRVAKKVVNCVTERMANMAAEYRSAGRSECLSRLCRRPVG